MITCPNCNHQNADTASFCSNCGHTLSVNTTTTDVPPSNPPTEEPTAVVAQSSPAAPASPAPAPPAAVPAAAPVPNVPPQSTNWPLVAGIVGVCVVASVGILALALTRQPQQAAPPEAPTAETETNSEVGDSVVATEAPSTAPAPTQPAATPSPAPSKPDITAVDATVWKVIDAQGLNCRRGAGSNHGVSTTLNPGKEFQVDPGYDNPLVYDNQGDPWLAIVLPGTNCFVRANTAYLQALPNKNAPAGTQTPEGICPEYTVTLNYLESPNFDVYICGDPSNGVPTHYSGFAKNGSGGITVPFSGLDEGGYYARNGDVLYHIDTIDMKLNVEVPGQKTVTESLAWVY
ncbi:MAG: zinc-ribbon domain-containing protein [Spirulina sp. SIO3F2]|nr:zinc-ribbon domain-containing protein [Spirulina sp. SIO3F2]